MSYYMDFCADCDRAVRRTPMGWYRCDCCGHESLRTVTPAMPPDVISDLFEQARNLRRAERGAGLVSLIGK